MRIVILTQPLRTNYGGLMQAYALQTILKRMGHSVVTDEKPLLYSKWYWEFLLRVKIILTNIVYKGKRDALPLPKRRKQNRIAKNTYSFAVRNIDMIDFFGGLRFRFKNIFEHYIRSNFDAIVVGSDQVWNASSDDLRYFLNFANTLNLKKVAYAASFGHSEWKRTDANTLQCQELIKKFTAVSVREDSGIDICKKNLLIDATHVLDPVLLLCKEDYLALCKEKFDSELNSSTLFTYVLDPTADKDKCIDAVASALHLTPHTFLPEGDPNYIPIKNVSNYVYPPVEKWICGFHKANFIFTDSFHGVVMSIVFRKPFAVYINPNRGAARFYSLLKIFQLESRIITSYETCYKTAFSPINYEKISPILEEWKDKSYSFLSRVLNN